MQDLERKVNLLIGIALSEHAEEHQQLKNQLMELCLECKYGPSNSYTIKEEAETILQELGVPCNMAGHQYLMTAICLTIQDEEMAKLGTYKKYERIAEIHSTKTSRIERSIRRAIEVAFDRGDMDVTYKYFGNTISAQKGKPTNAEFMNQVTNHIRRRLKL